MYRVKMDGKPEYDSLDNYTVLTGTFTRRIDDRLCYLMPVHPGPKPAD